jgi:CubicO group peptidase (beta-lactamase class C family)
MNTPSLLDANAKVQATVEASIAAGHEHGIQVCAYLHGRQVIDVAAGVTNPATGQKVTVDTLFNVFSVTKAVMLTAVHILAERGRFDYDTRVAELWPGYAKNGKEKTTVRHLLTHRGGVPQMPDGITPEKMCDWNYMIGFLENATPMFEPGTQSSYHQLTYGWLLSELVRRADPQQRMINQFVYEEIGAPLKAPDLWIGLPDAQLPRVAKLWMGPDFDWPAGSLFRVSLPLAVNLVPEIYERPDVRRAPLAGAGGIFTARSIARVWALLANGGELDGVRLLSKERVAGFSVARDNPDEPDPVYLGAPVPIGQGGYWLGAPRPPVASPRDGHVLCHPGMGGSIGWADPKTGLAVAITHNRMHNAGTLEDDYILPIANAVREALGLE